MVEQFQHILSWAGSQAHLLLPLGIALWIAWGDLRTYRIPNYLTLGAAVAGFLFQAAMYGLSGLGSAALGLIVGFFLLFPFYLWFNLGAGDVKALAALGTWLGPWLTLMLFCYMGIAGGLMALGVLIYKGLLWAKIRQGWHYLKSWILFRPTGVTPGAPRLEVQGLPYGVAMALGMVMLFWRGG
ncbi:MAG: A24 family peptidase [Desulfobaccales bacterium]